MTGRKDHRGVTLAELLVALSLLALLGALGVRTIRWQALVLRGTVAQVEAEGAIRVVQWVLGNELRQGVGGRDWVAHAGDSVVLRAYRGMAVPCDEAAGGGVAPTPDAGRVTLRVATLGLRDEDPGKDSLLVLDVSGGWRPYRLVEARAGGVGGPACPLLPGARLRLWTFEAPGGQGPDEVIALRYYEWGGYHLVNGALRYRRGEGGRQPLTPELFLPTSSLSADGVGVAVGLDLPSDLLGPASPTTMRREWTIRPREAIHD